MYTPTKQSSFQLCQPLTAQSTFSPRAYSPVNPVVCERRPNELASSELFIGNQWQVPTPACDCNDHRAKEW